MSKPINKMRRYHYNVYFPDNVSDMCLEFFDQINDINLTYHAAHQMFDDPRGIISLPTKLDLMNNNNILVEFYENLDEFGDRTNIIQKVLIRAKHLNESTDFSYLLAREGYIVSAWQNEKTDIHRLTNKSLIEYYKPDLKTIIV